MDRHALTLDGGLLKLTIIVNKKRQCASDLLISGDEMVSKLKLEYLVLGIEDWRYKY